MKESLNRDVAEFFFEKTSGFEKTPPESVWENISSTIPSNVEVSHFQSFMNHLHLFPILVSGVAVVALMYFVKPNIEQNNVTEKAISELVLSNDNGEKIAPEIKTETKEINETNKIETKNDLEIKSKIIEKTPEIKTNTLVEKNNISVTKILPSKYDTTVTSSKQISIADNSEDEVVNVNKRIYNINATSLVGIEKIQILLNNKEQELVKEIENPKPTKFGFYEIDITDFKPGTYKFKVLKNGVWTDYKIESFD